MLKLPKFHMVADFRTAMQMWSMRLGGFAALIVGYVVADPGTVATILFSVVQYVPEEKRLVLAVIVALFVFGVIYFFRLAKQEKLSAPSPDTSAKADDQLQAGKEDPS